MQFLVKMQHKAYRLQVARKKAKRAAAVEFLQHAQWWTVEALKDLKKRRKQSVQQPVPADDCCCCYPRLHGGGGDDEESDVEVVSVFVPPGVAAPASVQPPLQSTPSKQCTPVKQATLFRFMPSPAGKPMPLEATLQVKKRGRPPAASTPLPEELQAAELQLEADLERFRQESRKVCLASRSSSSLGDGDVQTPVKKSNRRETGAPEKKRELTAFIKVEICKWMEENRKYYGSEEEFWTACMKKYGMQKKKH